MAGSQPLEHAPATVRRAFGDVLIQIVARVGNLALGILVVGLLARALGRSGYGQWTTILSALQLLGFLTTLGLEQVVVREAASRPQEMGRWVVALLVAKLALTVPSMAIGVLVVLAVQDSGTMVVAGLVLLLQFPLGVLSSLGVVYQLRIRNAVPMAVLTLNSVLWTIAVVVIDVSGGGLIALAVALTGVGAVTTGVQAVASLRLLGALPRPSRSAVVELIRVGAPLGVAGLLINAYGRVDQIMVYRQAGSLDAGLYGAAYRLLDQAQFVPVSVLATLAPITASLWVSDRARMLAAVSAALRVLLIAALAGLAFSLVAGEDFMRLIFGGDFADAGAALPILAGAFVFICFGYVAGNLLLVLDLVRKQVRIGLVGLVVNVAGNLLLIPRYGYIGAAWMTLATEAVVISFAGFYVLRALALPRIDIKPVLRIVAASGALAAALELASQAGAGLGVFVVMAAAGYPALLFAFGAVRPQDVQMLRRARSAA